MRNGDMPASPIPTKELGDLFVQGIKGAKTFGLTKREHFAGLAPDVPSWYDEAETCQPKRFFAWRAFYADALLEELNK